MLTLLSPSTTAATSTSASAAAGPLAVANVGKKKRARRDNEQRSTGGGGAPPNMERMMQAIMKLTLSNTQVIRDVNNVMYDVLVVKVTSPETEAMKEEGAKYAELVRGQKNHQYGPPHVWQFAALLKAFASRGVGIGAQTLQVIQEKMAMYATATLHDRNDVVRFCRLVKMYDDNLKRVVLHISDATLHKHVLSALIQTGEKSRKCWTRSSSKSGSKRRSGSRCEGARCAAASAQGPHRSVSSARPLMGPSGLGLLPGHRQGAGWRPSELSSRERRTAGRIFLGAAEGYTAAMSPCSPLHPCLCERRHMNSAATTRI